jgi:hypothetical protein
VVLRCCWLQVVVVIAMQVFRPGMVQRLEV